MTKTMTIVEKLRFVPRSHTLKISKDERYMIGQVAHQAADEIERLQAKVDALMLEHCPDEMTPEQLAEWAKHQRPSSEPSGCPEHGMEHFFEGMCIKCGVVPAAKSEVCEHLRSELLARKGDSFEMRKCLDCTQIFRVRLSQRTNDGR